MKKLRLDIEQLAVESFASSGVRDGLGTVRGHSGTVIANYCDPNSIEMDCVYDPSRDSCGCVTPP